MNRSPVRCSALLLVAALALPGCGSSGTGPGGQDGGSCVSDAAPVFTRHLTDLSQVDVVIPPGSVSGDRIASHSYIGLRVPTSVPVQAPVEARLINGAFYREGGVNQYLLLFRVSCEVTFLLDHVVDPIGSIRALFPSTPANDTRMGPDLAAPPLFRAGDPLGQTTGVPFSGRWDFGVYNTGHVNVFGNNARYQANFWSRDLNAVCPYDYFAEPLRGEYYALFGTIGGTPVPGAPCRGASQDVAGSASGAWFLDVGADGTYGNRMAIAATLDQGQVRMGGVGSGLWIDSGDPTFVIPTAITDEHCYFKNGTVLYLKVEGTTALRVFHENPSAGCPGAMPSAAARTYVR